jgi:hypothetical protein
MKMKMWKNKSFSSVVVLVLFLFIIFIDHLSFITIFLHAFLAIFIFLAGVVILIVFTKHRKQDLFYFVGYLYTVIFNF